MLQIKNIVKKYITGDLVQTALDNVSVNFRDSEFVSILGTSGSGKTTLLNIIGELDRCDDGDMIVNGVSVKNYSDRDRDSYRNHTIGFVFQNYNLIPHRSVLANTELALTISGVSRSERKRRAKEILQKVGLGDQIKKKPNQLSGGQMQRVAVARALINNPDIILADEPTGALDSETGVQIMELLQKAAKGKLIIMVTHNRELAEKYSTRIVSLKDGKIISDTDPYEPTAEEIAAHKPEKAKKQKAKMNFASSLVLSFNNLMTKKGRTILTSFAGSVGIIGIALILSLSSGVNDYITYIQQKTMNSYPVVIGAESFDMTGMNFGNGELRKKYHSITNKGDGIYSDPGLMPPSEAIANKIVENNLAEFKKYLDDPKSEIHRYLGENGIKYDYEVKFDVYSHDPDGKLVSADADLAGDKNSDESKPAFPDPTEFAGRFMPGNKSGNFSKLTDGSHGQLINSVITDNYEMLYGDWPKEYNEVVLVLNKNYSLSPAILYQLGFITEGKYNEIKEKIKDGKEIEPIKWEFSEAVGREMLLLPAYARYVDNKDGTFSYVDDLAIYLDEFVKENGIPLKISGVIRPAPDSDTFMINSAVAYTTKLTDYLTEGAGNSSVIKAQRANPNINVLTGIKFDINGKAEKVEIAKEIIGKMSISEKASVYKLIMYYQMQNKPQPKAEQSDFSKPDGNFPTDENSLAAALDLWVKNTPDEEILLKIYDNYAQEASYESNMKRFGEINKDKPSSVSLYSDTFEDKDGIAKCIKDYNEKAPEDSRIYYTDYVALMTSSVSDIVDTISYVLIAFAAVSLIVSCIMIGIITHISVLERTKEIGILRALGASKTNISQVFVAETFIIGCGSGIIGVLCAILFSFPIDALIKHLAGNIPMTVHLPAYAAAILVAVGIIVTILGGLIPAASAAKKDPVTALRTE